MTGRGADLVELISAVASTFFKLRAAGKRMGAVSAWGGGTWGLMRSLAREGAQTVPELARARPVARQRIQRIADKLAAEGIVEFVANPRHKRSKLVRLTAKGQDTFAAMDARVHDVAATFAEGFEAGEIAAAIDVLRRLADRAEAYRAQPKARRARD
ncbi:MAG: MarR family transcriptional regulator [Alphaproteobacteria bacterium]